MYQTRKLYNILVTLDKNMVRKVLVVNKFFRVNVLHSLGDNYMQGNEVFRGDFW